MTRVTMNVYSMTNVRNAMRNIPMSLNTEIAGLITICALWGRALACPV